ncbi:MAG: TIM barrel protein [Nanoarchaeota archaeon]
MKLKLGINTGFALNRFPLPEEWIKLIGEDLGLRYVQLTADLINLYLDETILDDYAKRINSQCQRYGVQIDSIMTGAFTRVNHFSHPDPQVRRYWVNWFKKFIDFGVAVGATNASSHFGIMSYFDVKNPVKREMRLKQTVEAWKEIAVYAHNKEMKYLSWEPMSIAREYGETIEKTKRIQTLLKDSAIPIKLCLDVDHGDISSPHAQDSDPYAWLKEFAKEASLIHLKQSLEDKSGHHPFTPEYNKKGCIYPEKVIRALEQGGASETLLLLELSFREREPFESRVLDDLRTSVEYWRKFIKE